MLTVQEDVINQLRLDPASSSSAAYLDRLSSGRVTGYLESWTLFVEHPLTGVGAGAAEVSSGLGQGTNEIHNLWLRLLAEGGLTLFAAVLLVVGSIVRSAHKAVVHAVQTRDRAQQAIAVGALGSIIAGIVATMVEPGVILGSMFIASAWWAVAGSVFASDAGASNG